MSDNSNARASIFDEIDDLDLSEFTPRPKATRPRPDQESLREMAEQKGFTSREPAPRPAKAIAAPAAPPAPEPIPQRRYRTGRNRQLNLKVTDDALRRFYALADGQDLILGEAFEQAVAALEILVARGEAPPRPRRLR